eukprot:14845-Heterococcus_DN1.PRE.1
MTSSLASASGASLAAATVGTTVGTAAMQQQKHRVFTTALKGGPGSGSSSAVAGAGSSSSSAARLDGKRSPTPSVRLFGGLPTAATAAMQDDDQVSTSPDKFATVASSAGASCYRCTTVGGLTSSPFTSPEQTELLGRRCTVSSTTAPTHAIF